EVPRAGGPGLRARQGPDRRDPRRHEGGGEDFGLLLARAVDRRPPRLPGLPQRGRQAGDRGHGHRVSFAPGPRSRRQHRRSGDAEARFEGRFPEDRGREMSKATVAVRRAVPADGPRILELDRQLARFEKLEPPSDEEGRKVLSWIFETGKLEAFVAEVGGRIEGIALFYETPGSTFRARPFLYLE